MKRFVYGFALLLGLSAGQAQAAFVAIVGNNSNSEVQSFLQGQGHTVTNFGGSPQSSYAGFDVVILLRMSGNTALRNFVLGGGRLITEYDAADWALGAGDLLAADAGLGGLATSTAVTFTSAGVAAGLADGVSNPYIDGGRTEFFRNLTNIGPGVDVLATRLGNLPVIIGGKSGAGSTLVIGYDWADQFGTANANTKQLLLNAIEYNQPAVSATPEPASMTLLGIGGAFGLLGYRIRRRKAEATAAA